MAVNQSRTLLIIWNEVGFRSKVHDHYLLTNNHRWNDFNKSGTLVYTCTLSPKTLD